MSFTFCPLRSGSSGNALFVGAGRAKVLVDAGVSGRMLTQAMSEMDETPDQLSAILITHEHSDHVKGLSVIARRADVPVYATAATWEQLDRKRYAEGIPLRQRRELCAGQPFYLGDLGVEPFAIPHDAAGPVGYRFFHAGKMLAIATDLGHVPTAILSLLIGADLCFLESNHDPALLKASGYPVPLKARILGKKGHLSNADCADALGMLVQKGLTRCMLGHLSKENNTPDLALETANMHLASQGIRMGKDVLVEVAPRDARGRMVRL